ncbi:hypothetical protein ACHAXT_002340 [Thalassiosira profunda]
MGRRLAQERSRNDELTQQMHEMGRTIAMLQQEKEDDDADDRGFSSPPVATPDKGNNVHFETPRKETDRVSSSKHAYESIGRDPALQKLLAQASKLLQESGNSDESSSSKGGIVSERERMREYHQLVSAFCLEQDGVHELKRRFNEVFIEERLKGEESPVGDRKEWKECLSGLVDVAQSAVKQTAPSPAPTSVDKMDPYILQQEVASLNQRLVSFAAQHKETVRSLSDDMDAMKRDHSEQIAQKSQRIQNLEAKLSEQEEFISRRQSETQSDEQWIKEEKQRLELSKEGSTARIRYLEGMMRSLQVDLREAKSPKEKKVGCSNDVTPTSSDEKGPVVASPPVFMRDLASAVNDEGPISTDTINGKAKAPGKTRQDLGSNELAQLRDQIASLSNSLAESETSRADLLEEFQRERKKYMLQYKQLSDVLKQLIGEEEARSSR